MLWKRTFLELKKALNILKKNLKKNEKVGQNIPKYRKVIETLI